MSEDKELKQWKEKLFYQPKNGYDRIDAEQAGEIFAYAEGYKQFLNAARTEREAVKEAIRTKRFYFMWVMLFINITCGIALISVMLSIVDGGKAPPKRGTRR